MPLDPGLASLIVIRASAALGAAGAWDATPLEFSIANADFLTVTFTYTRAGAGGAFDFWIWTSPYSATALVAAGANEWGVLSAYAAGVLAAGVDVTSTVQRELITYQATAAGAESFVYGPTGLGGTVERFYLAARESGAVGTPGTLQVEGLLR